MRYFGIYKKFLSVNFSAFIAYRGNFTSGMIGNVVWGLFSIIFIMLLSSQSSHIYGWSREELYILTGVYNIVMGVIFFFFSRNFEQFASLLQFGRFDGVLLKPVDAQFFTSLYLVNYPGIFRILLGGVFTAFMVNSIGIHITMWDITIFLLSVIIGVILVYAVWFIILTCTIWNSLLSNLVDFMYTISGVARYPKEMFTGAREVLLLFVLPFTFVVNVPVKILLHKSSWSEFALLSILAFGFLVASRLFWGYAIRSYSSASS